METAVLKSRRLEDEKIISLSKQIFEAELKENLQLVEVVAPLYVKKDSGLNDDLNGIETAVSFSLRGDTYEIVHSLAKWKRWYLGELETPIGKGIVANMKAIRSDEILSPIHSNYVDQWDWEKVISKEDRTIDCLIQHAKIVFRALKKAEKEIAAIQLSRPTLPECLLVIHTQELLDLYPDLSPKQREDAITAKYGAVFLIGIGGKLTNGEAHDLRAPDYDDWSTIDEEGLAGLNGDLLVWDSQRGASLEISSMGIRVDKDALQTQLALTGKEERLELPFHQLLLSENLPYTVGGGIGQSRVAMFLTKKSDITDVQPIEISIP